VPGRLAGQALPLATVPACLLGSLSGRRLRYHSAQGQSCHVDVRQGWMPAPCHRAQRGCPQRCHRCARRGPAALVALGCSGQPLPRAQRAVRAVSASSPSKLLDGYRRCGALPACPMRVPTARASVRAESPAALVGPSSATGDAAPVLQAQRGHRQRGRHGGRGGHAVPPALRLSRAVQRQAVPPGASSYSAYITARRGGRVR